MSPSAAPEGGITIVPSGPKPTLIAQGKITEPVTGFSTTLNFPLPQLQQVSALHASGVPIGTPTQDSPMPGPGRLFPTYPAQPVGIWIRLDDVPVRGRLVVMQRHKGVASNYDCNTCPCPASFKGFTQSPSPSFDLIPHDGLHLH